MMQKEHRRTLKRVGALGYKFKFKLKLKCLIENGRPKHLLGSGDD